MKKIILTTSLLLLAACSQSQSVNKGSNLVTYERGETNMGMIEWVDAQAKLGHEIAFENSMDAFAADFVKLALRLGQVDGDYVDAYHGPKVWKEAADNTAVDKATLASDIAVFQTRLSELKVDEKYKIRKQQLLKLSRAMGVRLAVLSGETVSFGQEVSEIYDVVPPKYDLSYYDDVLSKIDAMLPGEGTTAERVTAFTNSFAIPKAQLKPIFDRAIEECKLRTQRYFDLPATENFRMEFVSEKSWSGYNYYQGNYESLIQINTDFPITIDRAVDLGCHEGYPGHHVWNLFIEKELVRNRGWIEYSVNPLFGPFGPLAEGTGNYGIELAFPGDEKITFEREVLFPMAGLNPDTAENLADLKALTGQLSHASNEVSRRYLDGEISQEDAVRLMQKYYLQSREKTEQRLRFVQKYRAYVINYNIGKDMAASYVKAAGDSRDAQWAAFRDMLTIPLTPGDIQALPEQ